LLFSRLVRSPPRPVQQFANSVPIFPSAAIMQAAISEHTGCRFKKGGVRGFRIRIKYTFFQYPFRVVGPLNRPTTPFRAAVVRDRIGCLQTVLCDPSPDVEIILMRSAAVRAVQFRCRR
jgi:hypothetical protein